MGKEGEEEKRTRKGRKLKDRESEVTNDKIENMAKFEIFGPQ